jgi:hypothetical protein
VYGKNGKSYLDYADQRNPLNPSLFAFGAGDYLVEINGIENYANVNCTLLGIDDPYVYAQDKMLPAAASNPLLKTSISIKGDGFQNNFCNSFACVVNRDGGNLAPVKVPSRVVNAGEIVCDIPPITPGITDPTVKVNVVRIQAGQIVETYPTATDFSYRCIFGKNEKLCSGEENGHCDADIKSPKCVCETDTYSDCEFSFFRQFFLLECWLDLGILMRTRRLN